MIIPDSVTKIGESAFSSCRSLTSVAIGNSVTEIGDSAFRGCSSLTNVVIPDSVTKIGEGAFEECKKLQYNKYDNGLYLGNANNPYFVLIKAQNREITMCNIHSNTKIIFDNAFNSCRSLTSVKIPDSVTMIGRNAFKYCWSLTDIHFNGTKAQWLKIKKGLWGLEVENFIVYCTDGKFN